MAKDWPCVPDQRSAHGRMCCFQERGKSRRWKRRERQKRVMGVSDVTIVCQKHLIKVDIGWDAAGWCRLRLFILSAFKVAWKDGR